MNQNRLFVGNLSYQTMENDIQDYFSEAGVVTSVNLLLFRNSSQPSFHRWRRSLPMRPRGVSS